MGFGVSSRHPKFTDKMGTKTGTIFENKKSKVYIIFFPQKSFPCQWQNAWLCHTANLIPPPATGFTSSSNPLVLKSVTLLG